MTLVVYSATNDEMNVVYASILQCKATGPETTWDDDNDDDNEIIFYESCLWCMIDRLTCSPAVRRTTIELLMPPLTWVMPSANDDIRGTVVARWTTGQQVK